VDLARAQGFRLGLLRPVTLYPFPVEGFSALKNVKALLTVEMNILGQMVDDVKLATGEIPGRPLRRHLCPAGARGRRGSGRALLGKGKGAAL
jgi:hypothetical protein